MASIPTSIQGLTSAEVAQRVAHGDTNAYHARVDRTYWQIVRDNVLNLFNMVLLVLIIIIVMFREYDEIAFASFSVILNAIIGMVQEIRAKRALDRLAALNVQVVEVYRDGKVQRVPAPEIVKDDVLPITPGDKIAVDGRVLSADSLEVDESLLTGESDPIVKEVDAEVYSGSFCIAGAGVIRATEVGANSTVNKLARIAKGYRNVKTPSQRKVEIFVEFAVLGMVVLGPIVLVAGYVSQLTLLDTLKNALVLVTSLVPQGLVLATTLSLTLGAVQISRHKTLIQRINAVESLANVSVLCFDKTGTLTRNELKVTEIQAIGSEPIEQVQPMLAAYLGNLSHQNKTAAAITEHIGQKAGALPAKVQEIPFTSLRKWAAVVLADGTYVLGAPERVLSPEHDGQALAKSVELAKAGQRVLAFSRCESAPKENKLDDNRRGIALIVMSDQVREDIRATLDAFYAQGVELKVISGDNMETVRAIATQAGMRVRDAYTGEQLEGMQPDDLVHAVRDGNLFARIEPLTKQKIIRALKQRNEYVAMVGDGVNDVPALKEAQLAIVMNDGTQISKDVADIVLLNNAMSTLPLAFSEGKRITQKIYGTAKIFLSKNIYQVLLFILVGLMALPFPITPIQISWVVFGTVNLPSLLLAFGLLRPTKIEKFTQDVLVYVLTSGTFGAAGMALMYAATYLLTGGDTMMSRSALFVFNALYAMVIFLRTVGVNIFEPSTISQHRSIFVAGLVMLGITLLPPVFKPHTFDFVVPSLVAMIVLVLVLIMTLIGWHLALRDKRMFKQVEALLS